MKKKALRNYDFGVSESSISPKNKIKNFDLAQEQKNDQGSRFNKILGLVSAKNFLRAKNLIKKELARSPQSSAVWNLKGVVEIEAGSETNAIKSFKQAIEFAPNSPQSFHNLIKILIGKEDLSEADFYVNEAISRFPKNYEFYWYRGSIKYIQENFFEAIENAKISVALKPDFAEGLVLLGNALRKINEIENAKKCFELSLKINPNSAEALNNLGAIYKITDEFASALRCFHAALSIKPEFPECLNNIGNIHDQKNQPFEAIKYYRKALKIYPKIKEAKLNLAGLLVRMGESNDAFKELKDYLEIWPNDIQALNNMAVLLGNLGSSKHAIEIFKKMISVPLFYETDIAKKALRNMGNSYKELGDDLLALRCYEKSLSLDPNYSEARVAALGILQNFCDWDRQEKETSKFPSLGLEGDFVTPFIMLRFEDNPQSQLIRAKSWADNLFTQKDLSFQKTKPRQLNEKIKLGYFGADFFDHATLFLMLGLLKNHDLDSFDIYIFSYGRNHHGEYGNKVKKLCTEFFDVKDYSDQEIYSLARDLNLDIAIDLKGYTRATRSQIFGYRLAPVQINYLGYPSTMGTDAIDYIVADKVIIPSTHQKYYSEKIIYLPDTYQPNDDQRKVSKLGVGRTEIGLPKNGTVLCCHNQLYKISRIEFEIWMRILKKVEGSVLWLLSGDKIAERNIIKEANQHGVSSDKIIFSKAVSHSDHLARLQLADLFLDTFIINAHTTASDALWAGVPVVTKIGDQFAARVAGSLLNAVGLSELVAKSNHEYESLILKLANSKDELTSVSNKLKANIKNTPLFDTKRYTNCFEEALKIVHKKSVNAENPDHIIL